MMRVTTQRMMVGAAIAQLCCLAMAQEIKVSEAVSLNSIVEAVEKTQAAGRTQPSYQVIRQYRLFGANDSKADSEVLAEVDFRPPANKNYRIQKASGSNRGQQIVRRVLDHEVEAASTGNREKAAITRDNYDFTYMGEVSLEGQPCYRLGLKPKRKDNDLIMGEAWVDERSFLVRQVDGEVARTSSWWLKKVRIKLIFGYIEGTWLQTGMEAVADIRIVGPHTLTSRVLDYRSADEMASARNRRQAPDRKN